MAKIRISPSAVTAQEQYSVNSVISKDGTRIGYRQYGQGEGVILVQGTMGTAHNFAQLAEELAATYTVYVPDRRGRGISGGDDSDYSIQKEVEDLDALLKKTGSFNVFGLSSGAIISLKTSLTQPAIRKLAIFEPPLFTKDTFPTTLIARYEKEREEGKIAASLITGMQAGQFGPPIFKAIPRWFLEKLVNIVMKQEEKKGSGDYVPMRQLASTLHYDFQLVNEMVDKFETFKAVHTEVLLLGGSKSPTYLKVALNALEKVLPNTKRVTLPGLGHAASWNTNRGGKPKVVAQELRRFFV